MAATGLTEKPRGKAPAGPSAEPFEPVLRWLAFTGVSIFAVVAMWSYGLVRYFAAGDRTHISLLIVALYVATSLHCLWRAVAMAREAQAMGQLRATWAGPGDARAWAAAAPRGPLGDHCRDLVDLSGRIARIDQTTLLRALAERLRRPLSLGALAADTLMKLGLVGTIVGFILMLAPVAGLDAADPAKTKAAMSAMSEGMGVAMLTTLAGLVGAILIKLQYLIVESATSTTFWEAVRWTESQVVPALTRDV